METYFVITLIIIIRTYFIDNNANYYQLIHSKKLFRQNTIYNSFRLKKHLVLIRQKFVSLNKIIQIKNDSFRLKKEGTIFKVNCILTKIIAKKQITKKGEN